MRNLGEYADALMKMVSFGGGHLIAKNSKLRGYLLKKGYELAYKSLVIDNPDNRPIEMQKEKVRVILNLFEMADKRIKEGLLSPKVVQAMIKVLISNLVIPSKRQKEVDKEFKKLYGRTPPAFLVIAPTKRCNLHCIGCYASSDSKSAQTIPYSILNRILNEKKQFWNSGFTVITGGEPFVYKSEGKDILDVVEEHPDDWFMFYTNGTLITKEIAKRMAKLGNISPSISLEGFEAETDSRRGKGTFKKILEAFDNLRSEGVPFGISTTAMRHNAELLVSDEFLDFYFNKQKATFGWIFQYMPIGRKYTLDYVITPEQRLYLFKRERKILWDYKLFYPDFWNSGVLATGCISAGREGGYLYIDWNGTVTPCTFFPYSTANIIEIYEKGGNLNDAYNQPFFEAIRKWQDVYGYKREPDKVGNYILGCPIRDHHSVARNIIDNFNAMPEDESAMQALEDKEYYRGMVEYDMKLKKLLDPYWKEIYLTGKFKEYEEEQPSVKVAN